MDIVCTCTSSYSIQIIRSLPSFISIHRSTYTYYFFYDECYGILCRQCIYVSYNNKKKKVCESLEFTKLYENYKFVLYLDMDCKWNTNFKVGVSICLTRASFYRDSIKFVLSVAVISFKHIRWIIFCEFNPLRTTNAIWHPL